MYKDKIWYLKRFNLFENFKQEEMDSLDKLVVESEIKKKQPIYLQGDPSEVLYFLKKGRVKITRLDESGKEITLTLLEPGEIFGELGMFSEAPRESNAVTMEDTRLCMVRRKDFEKMMADRSDLSLKITKLMGLRLRQFETKLDELLFRDVPSRLARLLIRLLSRHRKQTPQGSCIHIKLSQQELANLIGATREMTSSVLNSFKREGLIEIEHKYIYVLKQTELEKMAN
ncbi:MAG TPA: Crp/Fnr family transcriptional regulator [Bacteroidetes bacterium]|nr:Crp/Fnr family transcriptional regulator [Bacteroidota bacterium]